MSLFLFSAAPPESSAGEGGGGAETEAAAIRTKSAGQPEQRARPSQENRSEFKSLFLLLFVYLLAFISH